MRMEWRREGVRIGGRGGGIVDAFVGGGGGGVAVAAAAAAAVDFSSCFVRCRGKDWRVVVFLGEDGRSLYWIGRVDTQEDQDLS